jgi:BolA protein
MRIAEIVERKLRSALSPTRLAIVDESAKHAGHAGSRPEGETHFRVEIVSAGFAGKSRIERHRIVAAVLAAELAGGIHALSLRTLTPDEDRARN